MTIILDVPRLESGFALLFLWKSWSRLADFRTHCTQLLFAGCHCNWQSKARNRFLGMVSPDHMEGGRIDNQANELS